MKKFIPIAVLAGFSAAAPVYARVHRAAPPAPQQPSDNDQTIHAMHDEMARSMARLSLPGVDKPYYIQYRLLDLDIREVTATFGGLVSSTTTRNRYMSVDVRVGNYHLDSSNFVSEDGFQGFLGSTGEVGIDHDYNSLRQDLWLATDQAYKSAATQMSLKQAFLRSLTKPPEIDDFSQEPVVVKVDPRTEPDWTSRNWENEVREASAVLKNYPQLYGTRVSYYIVHTTYYLMNSEGTTLRTSRSIAGIEAAMDTQAADGMPLHNFYAVYVPQASDLPDPAAVSKGLGDAATQLMQLRDAPLLSDYTGPVLLDAPAAGSLLAQILPSSLSGARPPLSMMPAFDEIMQRMGGNSEWSGRIATRVLPAFVSLYDDPSAKDFQGQPLLGGYEVDEEGVKGERVLLVKDGILKDLLMSRRPGPDFSTSNGHARSALLSDTKPLSSNLFLMSGKGLDSAALQQKFLESCKEDGQTWCLEIKQMDNPALSSVNQQDFSDFLGSLAGGISSGERIPLLVYRVYVADGHEELVRGGHIEGLTLRDLHNMLAVGNNASIYTFMQNPQDGFAGTALGSFGSLQGGIPSTIVTPSLLLDEVEVRGFHGEPRRLPIVPASPLQ